MFASTHELLFELAMSVTGEPSVTFSNSVSPRPRYRKLPKLFRFVTNRSSSPSRSKSPNVPPIDEPPSFTTGPITTLTNPPERVLR